MSPKIRKAAAKPQSTAARRRFLKTASATAATAGTLGFPMIAKGQATPISFRWQSTWPSKDIFHEYAVDFGKKINAKLLAVQFNREGAAFSGGESFNEADFQDLTGGAGAFGGGIFGAQANNLFGNSGQPAAPIGGIFQPAKMGSFFGEPAQPPIEAVVKRFF